MKMRRALRSCLQSCGAITNFISTAHDLGSAAQLPNLRGVPPPVTIPLVALLLASGVGVGLLCLRIVLTRHWHQLYLVWNLVLAWLPLLFALLACRLCERRGESLRWKWGFLAAVFAWLIFLMVAVPLTHAEQTGPSRRVLAADYSTRRLGIVNEKGDLEWEYPIKDIHDAVVLPNGNILFQTNWTQILEMTPSRKIVWQYDAANQNGNAGSQGSAPTGNARNPTPRRKNQARRENQGGNSRHRARTVGRPARSRLKRPLFDQRT